MHKIWQICCFTGRHSEIICMAYPSIDLKFTKPQDVYFLEINTLQEM